MTKLSGSDSKSTLYCSFCGKSQHEVRKLIAGPTVFICDECVELCNDIIREEIKGGIAARKDGAVPTPLEICQHLDAYVIGQNTAKRVLSVAVHNRTTSASPIRAAATMSNWRSRTSCSSARPAAARRCSRRRSRVSSTCPSPWPTPRR